MTRKVVTSDVPEIHEPKRRLPGELEPFIHDVDSCPRIATPHRHIGVVTQVWEARNLAVVNSIDSHGEHGPYGYQVAHTCLQAVPCAAVGGVLDEIARMHTEQRATHEAELARLHAAKHALNSAAYYLRRAREQENGAPIQDPLPLA